MIIICGVYPDSTTDDYSNFCYGNGSGCMDCVIIEYSTVGGGDSLDSLPEGAAVASSVYQSRDQRSNQPIGWTAGTGLPRPSLDEAACAEARVDHTTQVVVRSERVPSVRQDRLRTRQVRDVAR